MDGILLSHEGISQSVVRRFLSSCKRFDGSRVAVSKDNLARSRRAQIFFPVRILPAPSDLQQLRDASTANEAASDRGGIDRRTSGAL